jgi:CheY-like chemotaxis protein
MTRVLVIEDNRNLATGLRNNLEIEGYQVDVAYEGAGGLALAIGRAARFAVARGRDPALTRARSGPLFDGSTHLRRRISGCRSRPRCLPA